VKAMLLLKTNVTMAEKNFFMSNKPRKSFAHSWKKRFKVRKEGCDILLVELAELLKTPVDNFMS